MMLNFEFFWITPRRGENVQEENHDLSNLVQKLSWAPALCKKLSSFIGFKFALFWSKNGKVEFGYGIIAVTPPLLHFTYQN